MYVFMHNYNEDFYYPGCQYDRKYNAVKHSRESSCFCPWKANTGQSWLEQCYSQYKKGRVSYIQKKNTIFFIIKSFRKETTGGNPESLHETESSKNNFWLVEDILLILQVWFFFSSDILGQSGSLLDSQTAEFNFSKTFDCVGFLFAPLFSLRLHL